ncbi:LytR C-terminal domain-containing protein [Arthrobacter sp. KBS0703]|uniref:LytR C-terminal domain-containing protein n=1 Tax=Arthrobacter sp. KBS0703 TaxID=1955698 RepID=UPI0021B10B90|nr:LytR C-terminal domain-containing protein [Arthrobacter sp. KBS0703]
MCIRDSHGCLARRHRLRHAVGFRIRVCPGRGLGRDGGAELVPARQVAAGIRLQRDAHLGPVSYTHLDVYKRQVQKDGWTLGQVSNWQGAPQQESVVFYSDAAQKANAEALGALLNITKLVETADLQAPVAVVLGPEFQ